MPMRRRTPLLHAVPVALLTLSPLALAAGCSSGETDGGASDTPAVAESADHNGTDVRFATMMVPHHAQALQMADMTIGRNLSAPTTRLVDQIRAAQAPEIEQLTGWLTEWDQPIPETARDHVNAGHGEHGSGHGSSAEDLGHADMPGMMGADQMQALEKASGAKFERMWLEMMVEHHRGAVDMAQAQIEDGEHAGATELARSIVESQQAEIEQMQQLLE